MPRSLGIDLGDARVGVAISDELNFLAHPLETIVVKNTPALPRILTLIAEKNIDTIIVGVPRNMDGSHGPASEKSKAFIETLKQKAPCRVLPWDERLTTVSAQRSLREAGRKAHEQKSIIDQAAAQIILQSWMDSQPPLPEPESNG